MTAPLPEEIAALLAPVPETDGAPGGAGVSLRYDPATVAIRQAREEDDASLPLGDWARPLKRADWPAVAMQCSQLLRERSKDLQLAAWLLEAWVHLHQIDGLRAGVALLTGLVEQYWPVLHPRIDDDGDTEARVAPLFWLNETLPRTLRLQIALMALPDHKPPRLTLDDWDRLMRRPQGRDQRREDAAVDSGEAPAPGREDLIRLAGEAATRQTLRERRRQLREIVNDWARLDALIDDRLGNEAPSLARVGEVLRQLGHAMTSLLGGQGEHLPEDDDAPVEETSAPEAMPDAVEQSEPQDAAAASMTLASASAPGSAQAPTGQTVMNRESAYRQLEQIAEFLQRTEPHSPIPYLVRRAITWGRMPLPQLMQEMLKQEGDVQRLFGLLGVQMDSE